MSTVPAYEARLQSKRTRLEQTYQRLRRQIRRELTWREQAAQHWKISVGAAALTGWMAGRTLGRWIWK
jgi:hypothetical protein